MTPLARYQELKRQEYAHDLYHQDVAAQNCADEADLIKATIILDVNRLLSPLGYTLEEIVKADLI